MSDLEIKDLSSNHHYRTEIPNIIFEIDLSPRLIGVYAAIKRCAGDKGVCIKSEKTLAQQLKITEKTLRGMIVELCEINPILGLSVLNCKKRISEHGDRDTSALTITDLWPLNYSYFCDNSGGPVKITGRGVKITERVRSKLPDGPVKITDKEEPLKKNLLKKNHPPSVPLEKTEKEEKNRKNAIGLAKLCKDRNLPFTERKVTSLYNQFPQACLDVIGEFAKRKNDNMNLKYPDSWLNKHVIEQHEFLEQKKDYE